MDANSTAHTMCRLNGFVANECCQMGEPSVFISLSDEANSARQPLSAVLAGFTSEKMNTGRSFNGRVTTIQSSSFHNE